MIECILAWLLLIMGIMSDEPLYLVASGLFAVAVNIHLLRKGKNDA